MLLLFLSKYLDLDIYPHILSVDPPTITVEPQNLTNSMPGSSVTFTIAATGQFLSYSWQVNEEPLITDARHSGADSAALSITAVRESDEGSYRCNVSNAAGSVLSNNAYLTVSKFICNVI